jgi:hypothetical protein
MPTINAGPTLPVELNPLIVYIILAAVIVIVAVASVSLIYFKRRKGKPLKGLEAKKWSPLTSSRF